MFKDNVTVEILVNGKPITEYQHNGNIYAEGRKGSSFTIKITNNNLFERVLAVVSVDGLSVINSELASESSPGYVINPQSSTEISGWRIDDNSVSEFVFSSKSGSYAASIDQDGHEGSIGVMIFKDRIWDKYYNHIWDKYYNNLPNRSLGGWHDYGIGNISSYPTTTPFWFSTTDGTVNASFTNDSNTAQYNCSIASNIASPVPPSSSVLLSAITPVEDDKIAVGHGESVESKVTTTTFDRVASPDIVFALFYDTKKGLEKRGIVVSEKPEITEPSPFPASNMYCKQPKGGWKK